jgi:iron complex transport system permease protein
VPKTNKHTIILVLLSLGVLVLFFANISFGSVKIPFGEVFKSLTNQETAKETWNYIILNYRLPKAITAVLAGVALSICGLLMQTFFRNPLAGPYVLGLSSGSSLAVAFLILGSGFLPAIVSAYFLSSYGIIIASCFGSFMVLMAVLLVSKKLRDTTAILIVGLMFGSFATAIIGVLTYFSTAEQLQKFTFWSMGNLGNLPWTAVLILVITVMAGLFLSVFSIKSLDSLLLGENYARSIGLDYNKAKLIIIFSTSILAGSITAFAGPIAFVGMAVPHISKLVFKTSSHRILFMGTLLFGAIIMLICDSITQLPGTDMVLPINAITSIIGAPVVIWLLMRKRKITV